jgi:hypothetical protein
MLVNAGPVTLPNNSALAEGTRVKVSAGYLAAASASEDEVGTIEQRVFAADLTASVLPRLFPGVRHMIAAGAISQWDTVYAAASGKIANTGTLKRGIALEAASGSGSVIKVLTLDSAVSWLVPTATVAAAGTVQGDAAAVTTGFTLVTGSTNAGVLLPDADPGSIVIIKNNVGGNMKVWPTTGDAINAGSANAAYTMATLTSALFVKYDATTWYTVPLVAS